MGSGASHKFNEEQAADFNKISSIRLTSKTKEFDGSEEDRQKLIHEALERLDIYSKSLTADQALEYKKKMKIEFDKFEGEDEDHKLFMINAHERIIGSLRAPIPAKAGKKKGGPTRRRSYGEAPGATANSGRIPARKNSAAKTAAPPPVTTLSGAASTTALAAPTDAATGDDAAVIAKSTSAEALTPAPNADSWDSVIDQPFCTTCQMAFKTSSALQRHVQYSDLHTKQVEKLKKAGDAEGALSPHKMTPATQETTLLYSGTKLYYKTGQSIEYSFYYQCLMDAVEVCAVNNDDDNEMNRIYLSYSKLMLNIEQTVLDNVAKRRREMNKSTKRGSFGAELDGNTLMEEARLLALSTFLLNRLQQADKGTIEYVPLSNDSVQNSPLTTKPSAWVPVVTTRRRRTTAEEVTNVMSGLATDYAALTAATDRAGKIANVVFEGVNLLKSNVSKYAANLTPRRKKWIWAIKRVIRQGMVADTHKVLILREKEKKEKAAKVTKRGSF